MYDVVELSNVEAMFLLSDNGEDVGIGFDTSMIVGDLKSLKGINKFRLNMETDCICSSKNPTIIGGGISILPVAFSIDLINTKDLVFLLSDLYTLAINDSIDLFRIIIKDIKNNRVILLDTPIVISVIDVTKETLDRLAIESLNTIIPEIKSFMNTLNNKSPIEGDNKSFSYQIFKDKDVFQQRDKITLLEIDINKKSCEQILVDRI